MEGAGISTPSLLCEEDASFLKDQDHDQDETDGFYSVFKNDSEHIALLMQRETMLQSAGNDRPGPSGTDWLKSARLNAIKCILETRKHFGFHIGTAYLSLHYLDQFLSRKTFKEELPWAVRFFALVCLSLAAKMEESKARISLKQIVGRYFELGKNPIGTQEVSILITLEWRMWCVTPFAYLDYFIDNFWGELRHKELETRANELISLLMEDVEIDVAEHWPSSIAAATVLAAHDCGLTRNILEDKIKEVPVLDKDDTFSCYSHLQRIVALKSKTAALLSGSKRPHNATEEADDP